MKDMLKNRGGFALPTVLIASVVMLAVLVTSISAVAATRTALQSQFFAQLARTAAESGLAMAESCINSGVPTWDSPLRTGGTCAGLAAPCSTSDCYLVNNEGYRTSFSVSAPTTAGDASTAQATGVVEQVRTSTGGVIRTYSQPLRQKDVRDGRKFSWQQISSTADHTCAITSDGKLYCWGANDNGQLGTGTKTDRINPTLVQKGAIPASVSIQSVAVGGSFTCALGSDFKVYCWGLGSALGAGTTTDSTTPVAISQGAVPAGATFQSVFAGQRHACAVASNSLTYCWGVNGNGQVGDGSTTDRLTPVALTQGSLPAGSLLQTMSLGVDYSCAVASDYKAYCWGVNMNGQLGDGTGTQRSNPTAVALGAMPAGSTVIKIATNTSHTCAIASNNRTYCWGLNGSGQLGDGTTTIRLTPVQTSQGAMPSGAMVNQISLGSTHTCAIASDNKVYCWGLNSSGQLGNNSSSSATTPVAVSQGTMPSDQFATSINLGAAHSCVVGSSNLVYCWGANTRGQLGDGTTTQRSTPVATSSVFDTAARPIFNIQAAGGASGVNYNCAIASDNRGYCWGRNDSGQLGNGTTNSSSTPVAVAQGAMPAGATIRQVSAGSTAACAVASNNKAYCWGSNVVNWSGTNRYGALGNGTTNSSSTPVAVAQGAMPAGATIRSISVGPDDFACAIASDNKTYCWGYNSNGELGNGGTSNSSTPVAVAQGAMPSTVVQSVVSGHMMACAIGTNNKAYCWGYDYSGSLGDGTTGTIWRTATAVSQGAMPAGATVRQLATGVLGACVIASDNKAYCWGGNTSGEVGDNTTTARTTPTAVLQGAMPAGATAIAIYAGSLYACMTASNNNAYCWGYNYAGQLGDGTTTDRHTPVAVLPLPLYPALQTTTYYF